MHVANFRGDVVFTAQEVQTEGTATSKIDAGCSFRNLGIGKDRASPDLDIRNHVAARGERPLEAERIYAHAVSCVRFLNHEENWDGVHCVLQAAAEKTGPVWRGQDQAITEARVPNTVAGLAATDSVAPAGPHLQFMSTLDRA